MASTASDEFDAVDLPSSRARLVAGGAESDPRVTDRLVAAAHELRAPLAAIVAAAGTLRHHTERLAAEEVDELLAVIQRQATRLAADVEQLLGLSEARFLDEAQRSTVDLADVIDEAVEAAPAPDGVVLDLRVPRKEPVLAHAAHHASMVRVTVNLLVNAYRHGGSAVTIACHNGSGIAELTVTDDGTGVPDHLVPDAFAPFSRADVGRGDGTGGAGLGLALARTIAEACGGTLTYEHALPHGARFVLRLPAAAYPHH